MKSQTNFLKDIVASLEQAEIAYMVSGSISSTFYGRPRSTQDVDIVIEASSEKLQELVTVLRNKNYYADEAEHLWTHGFTALRMFCTRMDSITRNNNT